MAGFEAEETPMKFGLKLHHSGAGASPEHMLRWTRFAETLGMQLIMTADHVALTPDVRARYAEPYYEPFTNMAWLAAKTRAMQVGTTVIVLPYRHPLHLAQLTANIDQLSQGRLLFGIGVGWAQQEFAALGVPYTKRGAITDDYLAALKVLWTDDVASYEGPFVTFRDVKLSPKPVQKPHPPIWVGGNSQAALRRTVRFADAWHPIRPRMAWLQADALPTLRQMAEAEGKPVPSLCPRIWCRLTETPLPEDERVAGEGTLDQIRRDLDALQEMGAAYVLLDTKGNSPTADSPNHYQEAWRTLTILAEKVVDFAKETVR
jgi:probable F420-dependent oxidoreductase